MSVTFTFGLGGNVYQVIRARKAGRRGVGTLDVQVYTPPSPPPQTEGEQGGSGEWRTIAESTIHQTQEKINSLLKLDYDTFINSAFLLQGRADEFAVKTPAERKKVLADILGLEAWETYEESAKQRIRDIEGSLQAVDVRLREIDEDSARRPQVEAEVAEARKAVIELSDALRQVEARYQQTQQTQQELRYLETQAAELASRAGLAERELVAVLADLESARRKADAGAIRSELDATRAEMTRLAGRDAQRDEVRARRGALAEESAALKGQNDRLGPETEPLKQRVDVLEASTEPNCPTCGQPLSPGHRHAVISDLKAEIENRRESYRSNQQRLKLLAADIAALDRDLAALDAELRGQAALQRREAELNAALLAADEAQKAITRLETRREQWQKTLDADALKQAELAARVAALRAELGDVAAVQAEYERILFEEARARHALGAAEQRLAACEAMVNLREGKVAERNRLAKEKGIYEDLRLAFGKKGVPAMIIEAAIPEIEDEANALLSRMTSGRMNLRFDTQKETQKGDTVETLDIQIADELGTRPYENFSVEGCEPVCIRRNGQIAYLPIQDLWREDAPISKTSEGHEIQPADYESLCYEDGRAVWLPTESLLRHPAPPEMLKITLSPGNYSVTLTPHHSVYVMTPDGLAVKRSDEVRPGDWMLSPRRIPEHQQQTCIDILDWIGPEFLARRKAVNKTLQWDEQAIWSRRDQSLNRFVLNDAELGEFLGLAVAEASGRNTLSFAVGSDRRLAERVVELSNRLFGVSRTSLAELPAEVMARYVARAPGVSSRTPQAQFRPVVGGRLLTHIIGNLIGRGARNKHLPPPVFNASSEAKLAFLRALIAGDGHLRVRPERNHAEIGITTISPRLAADTILLCRQLGIWARIEKHDNAGFRREMHHRLSYRVSIGGQKNVERLFDGVHVARHPHPGNFNGIPLELVNIKRNNGQRRLKRVSSDERFGCGVPVVPLRSRVYYERMLHWLQDWVALEVASVQKVSPASPYVYDLVVPANHSFVAGTGLILVHNSGGEQFRVNFALRVALSKLLARRAGAQLQTLVIDEGFGALDASGRERLVEAINAVQPDFERILVITHLDELKDAFPARIDVTKTESGSQIVVQ
jgi:DNA repair exonuclease SbcCD ATPase subunit